MTSLAVGFFRLCFARSSWNRGSMRFLLLLLLGPLWFSVRAAGIGQAAPAKEVLPTAACQQRVGSLRHRMENDACFALRRASTQTRRGASISAGLGPCRQLSPPCAPLLLRRSSLRARSVLGWIGRRRSCCSSFFGFDPVLFRSLVAVTVAWLG